MIYFVSCNFYSNSKLRHNLNKKNPAIIETVVEIIAADEFE